jgi:hypothetical protein
MQMQPEPDIARLVEEFRPSMTPEVMQSWASDLVDALKGTPMPDTPGWAPMETAPKDRRIILLYLDHLGRQEARFGAWYDDQYAKTPRPTWTWEGCNQVTQARKHQPIGWRPDFAFKAD